MQPRHIFISLSLLCVATPARTELVFFATGRTLSVKAHRVEDGSLILTLRSGGEVVCDPALITRIAPDETPYPEPEAIRLKPDPTPVCASAPVWVSVFPSWDPASAGFGPS